MWSHKAFDDTPETTICKTITDYISAIADPNPNNETPQYTDPNSHFELSKINYYPPDLTELLQNHNTFTSGWIAEIQSFWISSADKLYVFHYKFNNFASTDINRQISAVGYVGETIVATYDEGIYLFSYPNLEPIKSTYSIPKGVSISYINGDVAGCQDGFLRRIYVNPKKTHVSIQGSSASKSNDPIVSFISTSKYYVGFTVKNCVSTFAINNLRRLSYIQLNNIIAIWPQTPSSVLAVNNYTKLFQIDLANPSSPKVFEHDRLMKRCTYTDALWAHGFLTVIDSNTSSYDQSTFIRFTPSSLYTTASCFGNVLNLGIVETGIAMLTTAGALHITEVLEKKPEEEFWKFANLIFRDWEKEIFEFMKDDGLLSILNDYYTSEEYPDLRNLAEYVMTIADDAKTVSTIHFKDAFKDCSLSVFFSDQRTHMFSLLRKTAFEIRLSLPLDSHSAGAIGKLIELADEGDDEAEESAIRAILNSRDTVPPALPLFIDFLLRHRRYNELVEMTCHWASLVYTDNLALAFENANFPQSTIEDTASYHLRQLVLEQMSGFLEAACGTNAAAASVLHKAIATRGLVFQRFVVSYFENPTISDDTVLKFDFPGLSSLLSSAKSRHLGAVLEAHGEYDKAFDEYVKRASDPDSSESVHDRIIILERAIKMMAQTASQKESESVVCGKIHKAQNLLDCARILEPYIEENQTLSRSLFAEPPIELIETLRGHGELRLALMVAGVFSLHPANLLREFVSQSEGKEDEFASYVASVKAAPSRAAFSEAEVARAFFNANGSSESTLALLEAGVDPRAVFDLLAGLGPTGLADSTEAVVALLDRWSPPAMSAREDAADALCSMVLELVCRGDTAGADEIRKRTGKCLLGGTISDMWDTI